jgi:hypothetical protein
MNKNYSFKRYNEVMFTELTKDAIGHVVNEINKEENKEKINEQIINPFLRTIIDRMYPYLMVISGLYVLVLGLIIAILFVIIGKNSNLFNSNNMANTATTVVETITNTATNMAETITTN